MNTLAGTCQYGDIVGAFDWAKDFGWSTPADRYQPDGMS